MMSLPIRVPSDLVKIKRELSDGRERAAVQRATAVLTKRLQVLRSAVAFVPFEAILRVELCRGSHVAIARHLGDHARCCNRKTPPVALDQRLMRDGECGH